MTQKTDILAHLKRGEAITPMDALNRYCCFRLASVVHVLRSEGHIIDCEMVDNGNKSQYGRYTLVNREITPQKVDLLGY